MTRKQLDDIASKGANTEAKIKVKAKAESNFRDL